MEPLSVRTNAAPASARIVEDSLDAVVAAERARELAAAEERGRAAGRAEAVSDAAGALERAAEAYDHERRALSEQAGSCAGNLAVEIVRQLLRVEVPAGGYDLEAIVRDVLTQGDAGYGEHVVHVHPEDAERLDGVAFRSGTRVQPDPEVRRADVRLETPLGVLARDLDACLADIRERILGDLS